MKTFGLDEYTYNLLIDYFKSKPEIKIVRIYGSRLLNNIRYSTDVDMFIEGTYYESQVEEFKNEINSLRHPYRIDLIGVNEKEDIKQEFVLTRLSSSKYFYKRKEYFSDEFYQENTNKNYLNWDNVPRWCYRFRRQINVNLNDINTILPELESLQEKFNPDINREMNLFSTFKKLFEGCWKTLKDYYKDNNVKIFLPIEILTYASKDGIIEDIKIWEDMIIDFSIMTDEKFINVRDELFYRLKERYLPEIGKLRQYFQTKYDKLGVIK